jgi:hypothetical protein
MVKVEKMIRVFKEDKSLEVLALFDTGSRRSYLSRNLAEKIGYERLREFKRIPLSQRLSYTSFSSAFLHQTSQRQGFLV